MPSKKVTTNFTCCKCNRALNATEDFYKSYSELYHGNQHLPICKDCFNTIFEEYYVKYHQNAKKATQRICMAFDLYYDSNLFDRCNKEGLFSIGTYLKRLNMIQYQGKTYESTLDKGVGFPGQKSSTVKTAEDEEQNNDSDVKKKDKKKWGDGLQPEDYDTLNDHYEYLKTANPNCDSNQEIFINDLCYTKMQQIKAVRSGNVDDYKKLTESYMKTFQQAGLKTVPDTADSDNEGLGVWARRISEYTPEEYYKDKKLYKDFDGIGEYIKRFMLRPLKNLMFGSTDRDEEYSVKETENGDDDEIQD